MFAEGLNINKHIIEIQSVIVSNLASSMPFASQITDHFLEFHHKTLRSKLTVHCALLFRETDSTLYEIAAILEYLHAATLLHRHIRKPGESRRILKPIKDIWGNEAGILLGDYLLSRSFEILSLSGNLNILETISSTTQKIALGQMLEVSHPFLSASTENCRKIMEYKTASLYAAGTLSAAQWGNTNEKTAECLLNFGNHLGMATGLKSDLEIISHRERFLEALQDEKHLYPVSFWFEKILAKKKLASFQNDLKASKDNEICSEICKEIFKDTRDVICSIIHEQIVSAKEQLDRLSKYDCNDLIQFIEIENLENTEDFF